MKTKLISFEGIPLHLHQLLFRIQVLFLPRELLGFCPLCCHLGCWDLWFLPEVHLLVLLVDLLQLAPEITGCRGLGFPAGEINLQEKWFFMDSFWQHKDFFGPYLCFIAWEPVQEEGMAGWRDMAHVWELGLNKNKLCCAMTNLIQIGVFFFMCVILILFLTLATTTTTTRG